MSAQLNSGHAEGADPKKTGAAKLQSDEKPESALKEYPHHKSGHTEGAVPGMGGTAGIFTGPNFNSSGPSFVFEATISS